MIALGKNLAGATIRVADFHQWNLHLLKRAIVIEPQPRKLAGACKVVDFDDRVYFLARIPVRFKPDVRFQQLNLKRKCGLFLVLGRGGLFARR